MTFFFFLLSLMFGYLAYNLYYPVAHRQRLAVISFLAGWLVGEMPLHHLVGQVIITGLFVLAGEVEGLLGLMGFLICVASWLALGYFFMNSQVAEEEIEEALIDGLGEDYMASIKPEFLARLGDSPDYKKIKNPTHPIDPKVEVIKNIAYGSDSRSQKLDIYRARGLAGPAPVLFQIHGGAWTEKMGSKNEQALPLMNHMAMRDWVCVSIDYRLCPTATFPEPIIDCKKALAWVKENISDYGGNPDFIVVTGGSAGGHLSSLVALTPNDPEFQPGFEDADTRVQGAVPFYGLYDFTDSMGFYPNDGAQKMFERSIMKLSLDGNEEEYEKVSPLFRINKDAPPFLVIHGDRDTLVPVEDGQHFARQLAEISDAPVAFAEISQAQHAFDMFASVRSEYVKFGVERFLVWLYSNYLRSH